MFTQTALIVAHSQQSADTLRDILRSFSVSSVDFCTTCADARRMLIEREFDLVLINAPLRDESGENLSRHIADKGIGQVILVVKSEYYEEISANTEDYGVITISKPLNKAILWSALKLAKASNNRLKKLQKENTKLVQKIEDIRVVDRAKCILISHLSMTENQAHRHIEKQAMDKRATKREVAESILKTYEN